jgi:hypothetical protein
MLLRLPGTSLALSSDVGAYPVDPVQRSRVVKTCNTANRLFQNKKYISINTLLTKNASVVAVNVTVIRLGICVDGILFHNYI